MTVPDMRWRKASRSAQEGNCVEVGRGHAGELDAVRDSKNAAGPTLVCGIAAMVAWVKQVDEVP